MNINEQPKNKIDYLLWERIAIISVVSGIAVAVVIMSSFGVTTISQNNIISELGKLGPIGDWIAGSSMPFLTVATVILVFLTYHSQTKELEETRKLVIKQNDSTEKQRFESTFFQLLDLHHTIVNGISYQGVAGKNYFEAAYSDLTKAYITQFSNHISVHTPTTIETEVKICYEAFNEYYQKHQVYVGHYFRNIYNIVKLIHLSVMSEEEKRRYIGFLRAQLSTHEILLLFYNGMVSYGYTKFKLLMIKYSLLQHLQEELLIHKIAGLEKTVSRVFDHKTEIFDNDNRISLIQDKDILSEIIIGEDDKPNPKIIVTNFINSNI